MLGFFPAGEQNIEHPTPPHTRAASKNGRPRFQEGEVTRREFIHPTTRRSEGLPLTSAPFVKAFHEFIVVSGHAPGGMR